MSKALLFTLSLGVIIFWIGIFSQRQINNRMKMEKKHLSGGGNARRLSCISYMTLVRERRAPALPLIIAVTCMPLGIAIVFGAITWYNHLKLK